MERPKLTLVKPDMECKQDAFMQDLLYWRTQWGTRVERKSVVTARLLTLVPRRDW